MPSSSPDFTHRLDPALLPELMDEPCAYEDFRDCVRDIAATTRLTLAYRPTLRFLSEAFRRHASAGRAAMREERLGAVPEDSPEHPRNAICILRRQQPLHILDVGSGGGDMLRRIARWHTNIRQPLQLTGIDLNPYAARAATELAAAADVRPYARSRIDKIQWLTGDVFTDPAVQAPDLVLSSLVTHHMQDEEIVRFLRWMEEHARAGWFISDLVRSRRSYRFFRLLSRLMHWHSFVQRDGLVSIRRAFREADWQRLLAAAGIPAGDVSIHRCALGRLCLSRLR